MAHGEVYERQIHEMQSQHLLKDEAMFLVSQDMRTGKCTLSDIKRAFNSDNKTPGEETFYSSAKIEEMFSGINDKFVEVNDAIDKINTIIDDHANAIQESYNTLDTRISEELEDAYEYINSWIMYGKELPPAGDFKPGRIYCQYFD